MEAVAEMSMTGARGMEGNFSLWVENERGVREQGGAQAGGEVGAQAGGEGGAQEGEAATGGGGDSGPGIKHSLLQSWTCSTWRRSGLPPSEPGHGGPNTHHITTATPPACTTWPKHSKICRTSWSTCPGPRPGSSGPGPSGCGPVCCLAVRAHRQHQ